MKLVELFLKIYKSLFWSLEKQARSAGVVLGDNNFIASHFWGTEPFLIKIGSNNQITAGVRFFTHGGAHVLRNKYPNFDTFGKIIIGDNCYIGNNTLIMPGVTIGSNVLCAAGSVVTKSIPSSCVVAGNPAKFICTIEEYEHKSLYYNLNSKKMSNKQKKRLLASVEDSRLIKKNILAIP